MMESLAASPVFAVSRPALAWYRDWGERPDGPVVLSMTELLRSPEAPARATMERWMRELTHAHLVLRVARGRYGWPGRGDLARLLVLASARQRRLLLWHSVLTRLGRPHAFACETLRHESDLVEAVFIDEVLPVMAWSEAERATATVTELVEATRWDAAILRAARHEVLGLPLLRTSDAWALLLTTIDTRTLEAALGVAQRSRGTRLLRLLSDAQETAEGLAVVRPGWRLVPPNGVHLSPGLFSDWQRSAEMAHIRARRARIAAAVAVES